MPRTAGRATGLAAVLAVPALAMALAATGCGQQDQMQPASGEEQNVAQGPAPGGQVDQDWLAATSQRGSEVLAQAERELGDAWAGGYLDGVNRQIVVLTTDQGRSAEVLQLGAQPRVVERSAAELADWQTQVGTVLGPQPPAEVVSWGVDVQRNVVTVGVLAGRPAPAELTRLADSSAGAVVITEAAGPVVPLPAPGG